MNRQRILCPVDFSSSTKPVVNLACRLAGRQPAKLYLLHVESPEEVLVGETVHSLAEAQMDQFVLHVQAADLARANIALEPIVLKGPPSETITRFAIRFRIDLIVMGSHGRTGIKRVVMGSVAEEVLRHASCPVAIIRI